MVIVVCLDKIKHPVYNQTMSFKLVWLYNIEELRLWKLERPIYHIVDSEIPCLSQMISCFNKYESTILGVQPVNKRLLRFFASEHRICLKRDAV